MDRLSFVVWDLVLVNNVRMGALQPPGKVYYNRFDVGSVLFTEDAGTMFARMSRISENNTAQTTECLGTMKVTIDGSSIETSLISEYGASTCDAGFFTRRFDLSAASTDQMTNMSTPYLFVFTRRQ